MRIFESSEFWFTAAAVASILFATLVYLWLDMKRFDQQIMEEIRQLQELNRLRDERSKRTNT